jgi:hypothetical protein
MPKEKSSKFTKTTRLRTFNSTEMLAAPAFHVGTAFGTGTHACFVHVLQIFLYHKKYKIYITVLFIKKIKITQIMD